MLYEVITYLSHVGLSSLEVLDVARFDLLGLLHHLLEARDVITSYSIHYTKLYDAQSGKGAGRGGCPPQAVGGAGSRGCTAFATPDA